MTISKVLLIARHDLRDIRRQRSVWLSLLLIPFISVAFIRILPGVLAEREEKSLASARYTVATEGSAVDLDALRPALSAVTRLRVRESDDARKAVTDKRADVGLVVPEGAAAALATSGQADVEIVVLTSRNRSRVALGVVASALSAYGLRTAVERLTEAGLPRNLARPIEVEAVDLSDSQRGRRLVLAALLPLLTMIPLTGAIGLASQRITSSKDQRVFEPLLVLPLTRATLLAGKAVAGYVMGLVTIPAVVVPLMVSRAVPVSAVRSQAALAPSEVLVLLGIAALLLGLLVALGVATGAAARTSAELSTVLQLSAFPLFLMALVLSFRSDIATTPMLLIAPFFGPLLLVRDLAAGTLGAADAALGLGMTVCWAALLLALAARFIQGERSVLRPSS